ncbi:MAG: protein translocase subunit SecD [Deltaproteobacteria bacterium]|nr:protein translocase subunit SecD [Deltaproteobacteria bacterium]
MTESQRNKVIFIGLIFIFTSIILMPNFVDHKKLPTWLASKKITLGLDLRGGSYFVLGVKSEEAVKSQLAQMAVSIAADLKKEGIIRAKQIDEKDLEIILLGERNIETVEKFIAQQFPNLIKSKVLPDGAKVKLIYTVNNAFVVQTKKDAVDQAIETVRNRVDFYGVAEPTIQRSGEDHIIVQLPSETNIEVVKKTIGSVAKLEFKLVYDPKKTSPEVSPVRLPGKTGGEYLLEDQTLMTGAAVEKASVDINPQTGEIEVLLRLNSSGRGTFDRITGANVNRQLAIILDNVVQSAPNINSRISGGSAVITGQFTREEARQLAIVLRSGALPAPLEFLETRTVGATLGRDSINQGILATIIGTIAVAIFFVIYYKKAGIIADVCVILNALILLAVLALFGATFTLPGIAGLALTVGMAVDANVLIYERMREELRKGVNVRAAIVAGFDKAHWTILDANLTTLLTGLILFSFGTGPIRGFAVTLSVGILTTLFTTLFVSRVIFDVMNVKNGKGELSI